MSYLEKPVVETQLLSDDGTYGRFISYPLERGFGNTLGNSLRRVLLSSLPGTAVVGMKIEGVLHEFSVIPGVKEDVVQIVLSLKGLKAKLHSDDLKVLDIALDGPCELTAGSIPCDSDVEILNPNMHIATLDENAKLRMQIILGNGRGYVSAELNKAQIEGFGVEAIAIDAIYTPVIKVNYNVENTRVGQKIDYDKLTLDVWTNGVLKAQEAVSIASEILTQYLSLYSNLYEDKPNCPSFEEEEEPSVQSKFANMTIEDLDLSARSSNCLRRVGINTVAELAKMSEDDISKVRNMGKKSLEEVKAKLAFLGVLSETPLSTAD
ncbi:MAG: DNA-directed RNA polymerase subunit alpha [Oscillospiraceae bacterium]|jgi:DNA-directed RNA polymerase subunit alpha|nr:DNA-directed RNA polymerase subunit alpha [Oscillospiraceae bacterium]